MSGKSSSLLSSTVQHNGMQSMIKAEFTGKSRLKYIACCLSKPIHVISNCFILIDKLLKFYRKANFECIEIFLLWNF